MGSCEVYASVSVEGKAAGFCEHDNDLLGSIKAGNFFTS
jgi:hypothetical protein